MSIFQNASANREYWGATIQANRDCDARQIDELRRLGWRVAVFWESAVHNHPAEELVDEIAAWIASNENWNEIADQTVSLAAIERKTK